MRIIHGWLSASHPIPLAMVLLLTALVAVATAGGAPDARDLVLVLGAMLCSQLAIGWSNDFLDRHVDAVHQPTKPMPAGLVNARLMPPAIGLALALAAILGLLLGPVPLLLLAIGTLCGLAYNFGLKATSLSALPFVLAFAVLPLYVWTALDVYSRELLLLYPIGLTLPVAVHIANVLPDLESDRAQGRVTVAVRLGRARAVSLAMAYQLLPVILALTSLLWLAYETLVLAVSLAIYVALSLGAGALYVRRERAREVWAFRLIAVAAIVFASGWLAAQ